MAELTSALRFVHFVAAIALAGEFAFLLWVARPLREEAPGAWRDLRERCLRVAARWLALLLASGLAWFLVQASVMSGAALFGEGMLVAALTGTLFGQVAIARLLLAAALAAALVLLRRASARREAFLLGAGGALAAGLLAGLAATGHGAAEQGADRAAHLCADAVHLLAAGAWLGALPALAFALRKGVEIGTAVRVTRRFSTLGLTSVAALVLTGVVNTWYTVSDVPALFGTGYGLLLCAKLALFAVMVALAGANRLRWTPQLLQQPIALSRLRRNIFAEISLGLCILGLVAALGVTVPALHATIVWPFSHTLDWSALARPRELVPGALFLVVLGGAVAVFGALRRRPVLAAGGAAFSALALLGLAGLFVVPAHPTTYLESPIPYSASSILRGAALYAEHCEACHGPYGDGDGPLAESLPQRPPNLTTRLAARREGDLLWSIRHGVAGTPMPSLSERIGDERLWDILNFMRAQANADAGRRMGGSVEPWRPVTAPDFTFQIGRGAQESLVQQRGRSIVLLVFYSLPQSLPRLRELAAAKPRLDRMRVRVIAVPMDRAPPREAAGLDATMIAGPDPGLVAAYAMFTRTIVGLPESPPRHVEFLIDRQGYVRARAIKPGREQSLTTMPELVRQGLLLNKETFRAAAPRRHAH